VLKSTSKTETADTPYQEKPPKLKSQARPKSETSFATIPSKAGIQANRKTGLRKVFTGN
jgi:hypothetical protein